MQSASTVPQLILAPLEGLADFPLRATLTAIGGYDWGICPFVRVTHHALPPRVFLRVCPELAQKSRTQAGTPMRMQLLGSGPEALAENAERLLALGAAGIDLNFGCPSPTVNRHHGGAALLEEPELLYRITAAVRQSLPPYLPFTAKMRLGTEDTSRTLACALALEAGGIDALTVHGRTRADGYRPPARWAWIAQVRMALRIPVIANGEVWRVEDYLAIRRETGCAHVMLGRGALADPFLAQHIRGGAAGSWQALLPHLASYWAEIRQSGSPRAPGRLKQWLALLRLRYPEAETLCQRLRPLRQTEEVDCLLAAFGAQPGGEQGRARMNAFTA
ncbi:MAG: tRNA-dihydrouridine synthase family protein [Zoogloeaceae bacterium]|jgi:tRNA-dihydrouridine synthase C|nr:tRNA-dihydrouridine synthase family protein [Zoogloeaceae bacterium]